MVLSSKLIHFLRKTVDISSLHLTETSLRYMFTIRPPGWNDVYTRASPRLGSVGYWQDKGGCKNVISGRVVMITRRLFQQRVQSPLNVDEWRIFVYFLLNSRCDSYDNSTAFSGVDPPLPNGRGASTHTFKNGVRFAEYGGTVWSDPTSSHSLIVFYRRVL